MPRIQQNEELGMSRGQGVGRKISKWNLPPKPQTPNPSSKGMKNE
jgi:hypothetical protein